MQVGVADVDELARARILSTPEATTEGDLAWKGVAYSHAVDLLDDSVAGTLGKAQNGDVYL